MSRKREARLRRIATAKDRRKDRRLAKTHVLEVGKIYQVVTDRFNMWKNPEARSPDWLGVVNPGDPVIFLDLKFANFRDAVMFRVVGPSAIVKVIWKDVVGYVLVSYKDEFKSHRYFQRFSQ